MAQLKDALRLEDAEALVSGAHKLKGAVGNFAAKKAAAAAELMERLGKEGDFCAASDVFATLEFELAVLSKELKRLAANSVKRKS